MTGIMITYLFNRSRLLLGKKSTTVY